VEKKSDRVKYKPNEKNEYSSPKEKPPRYDLRRKHRAVDDPLEKKDRNTEERMKDSAEENNNNLDEVAKKIARKKIAARPTSLESSLSQHREGLENYPFKEKGVRAVAKTYKHMADAFLCLTKAMNSFNGCKSSEISPDGKLGGKGYIQPIKSIRTSMAECINMMSDLIDTFHDEVNSPYWKKTTVEDNPIVKEILEQASEAIDKAEDLGGDSDPSEKLALNEDEKNKVMNILKQKGHI